LCGVATFDSHWSCPVLSWPHRFPTARLLLCLKRASQTAVQTAERQSACSSRWFRPNFSQDEGRPEKDRSRPGMSLEPTLEPTPGIAPPRVQRTMRSTPQRYVSHFMQVLKRTVVKFATPGTFEPIFASRNSWNSGRTSPRSAAATGRRSDQFRSPFGSDRRDPNTLAPNRVEARTTPLRPSRISTSS
jgi:hypothetical protein